MLSIRINDIKSLTNQLFIGETFDNFFLVEGHVSTLININIDGTINKDFEEKEYESSPYSSWAQVKPIFFNLIKGKKLPLFFKIVLTSPKIFKDDLGFNCDYMLNIKYSSDCLHIVTGISYKSFSLDKEADKIWDNHICDFLDNNNIQYSV